MELIDIFAIIAFVILLLASIYMMYQFYICDGANCKAYHVAEQSSDQGTCDYYIALLDELFNDGIWPIPYIGASILTPLSLWFLGVEITVRSFAILFFVSFVVIYFMFSFFGHHYLRPISRDVGSYIESTCQNNSIQENLENLTNEVELHNEYDSDEC